MSNRTLPCRAMPCRAMPCRAVPCRAVPCRAVPCRAVPYTEKFCSALIQLRARLGFIKSYWQSCRSKLKPKRHALHSISHQKTARFGLVWRSIWFYKPNSNQPCRAGRRASFERYESVEPSRTLVLYFRTLPNEPGITCYSMARLDI